MREIKFRGKNTGANEWIYGAYIPPDCTFWREPSIVNIYKRMLIDPKTLGQYTGYKDANGKEIYEGDILSLNEKYYPKTLLCVVKYGAHLSKCFNGGDDLGFYTEFSEENSGLFRQDFMFWLNKGVKVIGNIHDNPELMGDVTDE